MRFCAILTPVVLAAALFAQPAAQPTCDPKKTPEAAKPLCTSGMLVAPPKVYDDFYLQQLLSSLQSQLASLHVVDQATLLSHIGNVQGGEMRQLGVAVGASGPPTVGSSTFTPASGVDVSTASTTPGTTTTQSSVTPAAPTPPAPTLALPSPSQSSLDTLNESMQLAYEIANLRLLLDGALSDRLQTGNRGLKTTYTLGFPITIEAPENSDNKILKDSIAEISVSIYAPKAAEASEAPSIVTLLPRERTYNVASLVDHSFMASVGAVIGGVFNVGGGILWGKKKFYLVQQQETVAVQRPNRCPPQGVGGNDCAETRVASFAWQIHPVLGKHYVRPGTSQNFVQFSVPSKLITSANESFATACVEIGWRHTFDNGNRSADHLTNEKEFCYRVGNYQSAPQPESVLVHDIGQGLVSVEVHGTFLPGVTVRICKTVLDPATVTVSAADQSLTFTAAAKDIAAAGGASLIGRDGQSHPILFKLGVQPPTAQPVEIDAAKMVITPVSDTLSEVKIPFTPPSGLTVPFDDENPKTTVDPWIVIIGDKVFGLRDAPFRASSVNQRTLLVSTELLRSAPALILRRLLWPDRYFVGRVDLDFSQIMTVSKVSILSAEDGLKLSLLGTGLDQASLLYPNPKDCKPACKLDATGHTFAIATLPKPPTPAKDAKEAKDVSAPFDPSKDVKQIVLCRKDTKKVDACDAQYPPVVVDVPKADAAKVAKPALEKASAPVGTSQVSIPGTGLDQIIAVRYGKMSLGFRIVVDKSSAEKKTALILTLPREIYSAAGIYTLTVTLADKTAAAYALTIESN
jgi:hypothetical protein